MGAEQSKTVTSAVDDATRSFEKSVDAAASRATASVDKAAKVRERRHWIECVRAWMARKKGSPSRAHELIPTVVNACITPLINNKQPRPSPAP